MAQSEMLGFTAWFRPALSLCVGPQLRLHDSRGDQVLSAALENYSWQGAWRRPKQHRAIGSGKSAPVAGTVQAIFVGPEMQRARSMSANAAEGDICIAGGAEQDARLDIRRVGENLRAAHGNFSGLRHHDLWISLRAAAEVNDDSSSQRRETGHPKQLIEPPARDVLFVFGGDVNSPVLEMERRTCPKLAKVEKPAAFSAC
jgi:hypothetical protein